MSRIFLSLTLVLGMTPVHGIAGELTTKKSLNLAAIKTMVAAAEAEAQTRKVQVSLCIVDEEAVVIFLQKADGAGINTLQYAQKKARHSALYRSPSKNAADSLKAGNLQVLIQPESFPNQGGLPIRVDGQVIGAIAASGAASEIDEAIAQAGIDALLAWLK
jgi:glc operon protein GlcG